MTIFLDDRIGAQTARCYLEGYSSFSLYCCPGVPSRHPSDPRLCLLVAVSSHEVLECLEHPPPTPRSPIGPLCTRVDLVITERRRWTLW